MTKIIGITGNSGSGKSKISGFIKDLGAATIDVDKVAKEAMDSDSECLNNLRSYFGDDIFDAKGNLLRKVLADKAFSTKENVKKLNAITHDVIVASVQQLINEYKSQNIDIIVIDAAILFESGIDKLCDKIIVAVCPFDIKLKRIMARDNISKDQAKQRLNAQTPEEEYIRKSDYVINSNIAINELKEDVCNIVDDIKEDLNVK